MSEEAVAPAPASAPTAGRLLREAREKQGLHIAALAASIKVAPKKLELLESDRFDELPDATFVRALAQTVCRALKVDAAPVMRLLPPPRGQGLENVGEGLNAPFRERPGALVQSAPVQLLSNPGYWLAGLLAAAAIAVFFLPAGLLGLSVASRPASSPRGAVEPGMPPEGLSEAALAGTGGASAASEAPINAPVAATLPVAATPAAVVAASAPTLSPSPATVAAPPLTARTEPALPTTPAASAAVVAAAAAPTPAGMLQLRATAPSWVEVTDGRGQPLFSRLLKAGEAVGVDGAPPLRVRIGNASGTELVFRGQSTDLRAFTANNVARLELR